jgi:N-acetylglucosaminyl-diphospho-decaprenol L-rhamnosyltransferase
MVDLTAVIVSWNVRSLLERCLRSVVRRVALPGAGTSETLCAEVIVVDNGSTDDSPEMVRNAFPSVRVVANPENRGFAAANNQAIVSAQGRYVLLLNPDTEVIGDALRAMVAYADAHRDVGVVGPQLLFTDGSVQPSRYRFPTLATAVFESTWIQSCAPKRVLDRYYMRDERDDATHDVDWVRGAALMARREAIEQVGLLDEGYFMYSEELDWCRRIRDSGWRVVYLPEAQIIHHEGKSSEQAVAARHANFQTSKVRYFRKFHGKGAAEFLRLFLLGTYIWQTAVEGSKWLIGHKRDLRAQRLRAYRQVLRSRLRSEA